MRYLLRAAICGLVLACACLALPARAQQANSPEALQAASELSAIITGQTIEQMSRALTEQIWPSVKGEFEGKVDQATLDDLRTEFQAALADFTTRFMTLAPPLYAKYFTAAELRDMLAFYRTPTGVKALHTMPALTAEITGLLTPRMAEFQQDLGKRIAAVMTKHGYAK